MVTFTKCAVVLDVSMCVHIYDPEAYDYETSGHLHNFHSEQFQSFPGDVWMGNWQLIHLQLYIIMSQIPVALL